MKINRSMLAGLVAGIAALAVSSCAYDPYYSGGSYSSGGGGYGDGYGYGGSSFSTSVFVGTGNSRWGYDPYAGAYYDYTRRAYYDPYLYGYYPVGYRPRYVVGSPHPHGWHRGSNYCAPPSRISSHNLTNYHNRGERYRGLGQSWSKDVRISTPSRDRRQDYGPNQQRPSYNGRGTNQGGSYGNGSRGDRGTNQNGMFGNGSRDRGTNQFNAPSRGGNNDSRGSRGDRGSSFGDRNTSVTIPQPQQQPQRPQFNPAPDRGRDRSGWQGGGGSRGSEPQRQPTIIPQAPASPAPQMQPDRGGIDDGSRRGGGGSFNRGNGGERTVPQDGGGGRGGRGVRGLGEG